MSANFTPSQQAIRNMQPFRFWCQKVLPTVYDDSLSYYELLNKVIIYLNDTVDNVNTLNTNVQNIYNAYVLLQSYVNDYFDNEFPQLVSDKLDEMAEDGTLTALISGYIDPLFEAKSDEIDGIIEQQNTTISSAITEQNNTIGSAITEQNNTISEAITEQNSTINSAITQQDSDISLLQTRMNNFINNHAGLVGETVLWNGSSPLRYERTTAELNDLVSNYAFIDFYYNHRGKRAVQRFQTADVLDANGFYIRDAETERAPGNTPQLYPYFRIMQMKLTHSVSTNSVITMAENSESVWDGSFTINPATSIDSSECVITKIVGVNMVQTDSEVADARVAEDGTVYTTLEERLNTEFEAVKDQIEATTYEYALRQSGNSITQRINLMKDDVALSPAISIDANHANKDSNNLITSNAVFKTVKVMKDSTGFVPYDPSTTTGIAPRIEPNIYYEFGYVDSINASYPPTVVEDDGSIKDYYFTFNVAEGRTCNLTLPNGVVMQTGFNPTGGHKYEIHISNNLAKFAEFNL